MAHCAQILKQSSTLCWVRSGNGRVAAVLSNRSGIQSRRRMFAALSASRICGMNKDMSVEQRIRKMSTCRVLYSDSLPKHPSEFVIDVESTPAIDPDEFTRPIPALESNEASYFDPDAVTYDATETDVLGGVEYHLHDGEYEAEEVSEEGGELVAEEQLIDSTPWYLRTAESMKEQEEKVVEPLPEMPKNSPKQLESILKYVIDDLGLQEVAVSDLRSMMTVFGNDAIMVVCTARSERHLNRAAEELRVHLKREFRSKPRIEGLVGKERMKVQERRIKKKLSRYTGDMNSYEKDLRSQNSNSWVFVKTGIEGIHVHIITGERRWELDLEGLWGHEMPRLHQRIEDEAGTNLMTKDRQSKRTSRKIARKWAAKGGVPVDDSMPAESPEHTYYTADTDKPQRPIAPGFHTSEERLNPFIFRRGYHTSAKRSYSTAEPESAEQYHTLPVQFDPLVYDDAEFNQLIVDARHTAKKLLWKHKHGKYDSSVDLESLKQVAVQLCVAGKSEIVKELAKLVPRDTILTIEGDDIKSLLIASHTNALLLEFQQDGDAEHDKVRTKRFETESYEFTPAKIVEFPDPLQIWPRTSADFGLSYIHWRRQLEYLQIAHTLFPYSVPFSELQMHLVRQYACGVPITMSDFYLGLTTLAKSGQFTPNYLRNRLILDQPTFSKFNEKRFASIVRYFRTVGRLIPSLENDLLSDTKILTILYRACTQFNFNKPVDEETDVVPMNKGKYQDIGLLRRPIDPRIAIIDKLVIRSDAVVNSSYIVMSLNALAQSQRFDLFWKKWRDLALSGVNRDAWLWAVVAVNVSRSEDTQQMSHFLDAEWSLMVSELTADGRPLELPLSIVKATLVCLHFKDPYGVLYPEISQVCGRAEVTQEEIMSYMEEELLKHSLKDKMAEVVADEALRAQFVEEMDEEDEFF
ncbi:hypothetical protein BZA70DRAFT_309846 [Myxozyma melibiosi]|uniref:ATPase synthesis protein 25 n=1 Tax=Myxozyma melibiosi TaxID=54550 RepID=A0ABR1F8E1_9ASCO